MPGTNSDRVLVGWLCGAAALAWAALAVVTPDEDALGPGEVVVAVPAHDLPTGHVIAADDLVRVRMPQDFVAMAAITDPEALVGRVTRERLLESDVVRSERLVDVGGALLPRGMVQVVIPLAPDAGAREMLQPGNFADLIVTKRGETRTLLMAVPVLEVGEAGVALAVTEPLAERLSVALGGAAQAQLTLRNDVDVTHVDSHGPLIAVPDGARLNRCPDPRRADCWGDFPAGDRGTRIR